MVIIHAADIFLPPNDRTSSGGEALAEGEHVGRGAGEGAGAAVRVGEGDEVKRMGRRGEVLGVGGEGQVEGAVVGVVVFAGVEGGFGLRL